MTQLSVAITEEQDAFVADSIASGQYVDADAVVQEALRTLERKERNAAAREAIEEAVEEGIGSGSYEGDAFADVRREMGWEAGA